MSTNYRSKFRNILFVVGLGMAVGYYAITCVTMILAFQNGGVMTIIWTNIFGEAGLEFFITIISIPIVIFTVKETIDIYKKNQKVAS